MIRNLLFTVLLLPSLAGAGTYLLDGEQWARPRSGGVVVSMRPVADGVREWRRTPGSRLVIGYPGGEEGSLWAQELKDWLVSLGIPSSAVDTVPGSPRPDAIAITIRKGSP
jgi:hypothetical protein